MNKPTWLYKPIDLPNYLLSIFQQEFMKVFEKYVYDLDKQPIQLVSEQDIFQIPIEYPQIYRYLKLLNLHTSIVRIGLIVVNSPKLVIHSDWPATGYALNIPVLNCENTYTAWYDAKPTNYKAKDYSTNSWSTVGDSPLYNNDEATEIDRIESNKPHWINVHVPHSPICNHTKLRINGTIRFTENVYKYLTSKYPESI